jgi:hypothetical protein
MVRSIVTWLLMVAGAAGYLGLIVLGSGGLSRFFVRPAFIPVGASPPRHVARERLRA